MKRLLIPLFVIILTQNLSALSFLEIVGKGTPEQVKSALENGADINMRFSNNGTALMFAAGFNSNAEVIQVLLDAGADIDKTTREGMTALMLSAALSKEPAVVSVLLDYGANVNLKSNEGKTASDYAEENANQDIINLFKPAESHPFPGDAKLYSEVKAGMSLDEVKRYMPEGDLFISEDPEKGTALFKHREDNGVVTYRVDCLFTDGGLSEVKFNLLQKDDFQVKDYLVYKKYFIDSENSELINENMERGGYIVVEHYEKGQIPDLEETDQYGYDFAVDDSGVSYIQLGRPGYQFTSTVYQYEKGRKIQLEFSENNKFQMTFSSIK